MKYLYRILVLPFILGLTFIGLLILWIKYVINFVRFGGEFISYTNTTQRKTIEDVFKKLVENDFKNK